MLPMMISYLITWIAACEKMRLHDLVHYNLYIVLLHKIL